MDGEIPQGRRAVYRRYGPACFLVTAELSDNKSEKRRVLKIFRQRRAAAPEETPEPADEDPKPVEEPKPEPPAASADCAAIAKQYAQDVVSGAIVAGKFVRLACQRFLNDLEKGAERSLVFDAAAAQRVVDYLNRLKLGTLLAWQHFLIANLFGFKRTDGRRRFRNAYVQIAKKNGKSTLLAALGLYLAGPVGDQEPRGTSFMPA